MTAPKLSAGSSQGACGSSSYTSALKRFSKNHVADRYPSEFRNTMKDRREVRGILKALSGVPRGAHVLDLPCGSGRLLRLLLENGFKVTGADSSESMVRLAQARWQELQAAGTTAIAEPRFLVSDVMQSGFADGQFDAVICNRLFHHFAESQTRVRALAELRRISKGPIAVSFFNSFAVDAFRLGLKHAFRRHVLNDKKPRRDRLPIPMTAFLDDLRRAGLEVARTVPVLFGISPMWYVVALPPQAIASSRKAA